MTLQQPVVAPQIPVPPLPPDPTSVIVTTGSSGPPQWIAPLIVTVLAIIAVTVLVYPICRAWQRRIERGTANQDTLDELAQLRERVADLEAQHVQFAELEERLDFAERLLLQREDGARIERGDAR